MSDEEFILLIVTELILNLNIKQMSKEEFISSIVTELNLNLNVKRMSNKEYILLIVTELNLIFQCQINVSRRIHLFNSNWQNMN